MWNSHILATWRLRFLNVSKRILKNQLDILNLELAGSERFITKVHLWLHLQGVTCNWTLSYLFQKKAEKNTNFEVWKQILSFSENFEIPLLDDVNEQEPEKTYSSITYQYDLIAKIRHRWQSKICPFRKVACQQFFPGLFKVFFTKMLILGRSIKIKKSFWVN